MRSRNETSWCAWGVSYVGCKCSLYIVAILSMTDMVCIACMQKLWSAWAVLGLYHVFWSSSFIVDWTITWRTAVGRKAWNRGQCQQLFSGSFCHRTSVNSCWVALIATESVSWLLLPPEVGVNTRPNYSAASQPAGLVPRNWVWTRD